MELVRKSYVQPLTVKWVRDHEDNGNLTNYTEFPVELMPADPPVFLTWAVEAPLDAGGTLQVELKLAKVHLLLASIFLRLMQDFGRNRTMSAYTDA